MSQFGRRSWLGPAVSGKFSVVAALLLIACAREPNEKEVVHSAALDVNVREIEIHWRPGLIHARRVSDPRDVRDFLESLKLVPWENDPPAPGQFKNPPMDMMEQSVEFKTESETIVIRFNQRRMAVWNGPHQGVYHMPPLFHHHLRRLGA